MEASTTPGVIFKSRFVFSQQKFSQYINYIDRSAAVRSQGYELYSDYVGDYMDNPKKQNPYCSEKASALFTATKDRLSREEKEMLKRQFQKAQQANSPMWQQVISFTNSFLQDNGLYDSASGLLDEDRIRFVTRQAMAEMLKAENMDGSAVWSASIHYNTDNIHVHIAVVEPNPARTMKDFLVEKGNGQKEIKRQYKGSMKPSTFKKVKSKIVNNIVDRSAELSKINQIIRDDIVKDKRSHSSLRDKELRGAFLNLYRQMPSDMRTWFYGMNALNRIRPQIDRLSAKYIQLYHKQDFEELTQKLKEQENFLKSVYGQGKQEQYRNYTQTKMEDLYTRMGNAILRELREYHKKVRTEQKKHTVHDKFRDRIRVIHTQSDCLYHLKKALRQDYLSAKNQFEFAKLQQELEQYQEPEW